MALNYHQQRALVKGFAGGKHSIGNHQIQTEKKILIILLTTILAPVMQLKLKAD